MMLTTPSCVLESVRFRLKPEIPVATFLVQAERGRAVLAAIPGFRRRALAETQGQWLDVVEWQSMQAAEAAAAVVISHPDFAGFMAAIDETSVEMQHLTLHMAMA